jgi:hypothetical protein
MQTNSVETTLPDLSTVSYPDLMSSVKASTEAPAAAAPVEANNIRPRFHFCCLSLPADDFPRHEFEE